MSQVVEGHPGAVSIEMRRGFAELRSAIKLSHAQLENRLTRVECDCADLHSRL